MATKNVKKTYELKLDFQVKINEDKELEIIQYSIEELRVLFENHPKKPLLESLWMLGNPSKYARVLRLIEEALKNAKLKSITEEAE